MKGFYQRCAELAQKRRYSVGIVVGRESIDGESQFLNSMLAEEPLIGMIPMTGKGIDAEIDDLYFCKNVIIK